MTTQEKENIELIKEFYASYTRGDVGGLLDALADDVDWQMPGPAQIPYAGAPRHGRGQVAEFFATAAQALEVLQFEPLEFIASGDKVVVLGRERLRARATGRSFENDWVMLYTLRDRKIKRFREYGDVGVMAVAFTNA